jgi:hypothetical protein
MEQSSLPQLLHIFQPSHHILMQLYQQHVRQNKVDTLPEYLVYLSGRLGSLSLEKYHSPVLNSPM